MFMLLKHRYWQIRNEPNKWLEIGLQDFSPRIRAKRKYASELDYWRRELANLERWFIRGEMDWWGVLPPSPAERDSMKASDLWPTNAITFLYRRNAHLLEELGVEADAFAGRRVLEVGCGPLLPILQFEACERHGIDPLMNAFADAGWPIYDLDARMLNGFGENMPYADGYFDVVVSRNAFDHVDDMSAVAAEITRVLRPGGRFLCAVDYHAPTQEEPHQLDDMLMTRLFSGLRMNKIRDRSKVQIHEDVARRFNLSLEAINRRSNPNNDNRFTAWHGTKPG